MRARERHSPTPSGCDSRRAPCTFRAGGSPVVPRPRFLPTRPARVPTSSICCAVSAPAPACWCPPGRPPRGSGTAAPRRATHGGSTARSQWRHRALSDTSAPWSGHQRGVPLRWGGRQPTCHFKHSGWKLARPASASCAVVKTNKRCVCSTRADLVARNGSAFAAYVMRGNWSKRRFKGGGMSNKRCRGATGEGAAGGSDPAVGSGSSGDIAIHDKANDKTGLREILEGWRRGDVGG